MEGFSSKDHANKIRNAPLLPPLKSFLKSGTGDFRADGTDAEHGFGKFTFSDGSTYTEEWTSTIGGGRDIGTAVYYNGTGRFAGIKGGSNFDCLLMADRFLCEADGRIELP
jgi:hypothetical protein